MPANNRVSESEVFCFVLIENEPPCYVGNNGPIHRSSQSIHFSSPIHHRPVPFRSLYLHCGTLPVMERLGLKWRQRTQLGAVVGPVPGRLGTSGWHPVRSLVGKLNTEVKNWVCLGQAGAAHNVDGFAENHGLMCSYALF
jgi:hypothetical protein